MTINSIIPKDEKVTMIKDIMTFYTNNKSRPMDWYGDTYEKLMDYPEKKLFTLHRTIKRKENEE